MKTLKRPIAIVIGVAFIATAAFRFYLPYEFVRTRPRNPDAAAGQTIPLNNHDVTVYISGADDLLLGVTLYASLALAIVTGLLLRKGKG